MGKRTVRKARRKVRRGKVITAAQAALNRHLALIKGQEDLEQRIHEIEVALNIKRDAAAD